MGIPKPRESDLVRQCLDYLAMLKIMAWRQNTTGVYDPTTGRFRSFHGRKGVSDILGCLPGGRLLAIECKQPKGQLSEDQRQFIDDVNRHGGCAFVVRTIDDLMAALARLED